MPAAKQAAALAQQALPPTLAAGFEQAAEESLATTVAPSPAIHTIFTVLKAGETVSQTLCGAKTVFETLPLP